MQMAALAYTDEYKRTGADRSRTSSLCEIQLKRCSSAGHNGGRESAWAPIPRLSLPLSPSLSLALWTLAAAFCANERRSWVYRERGTRSVFGSADEIATALINEAIGCCQAYRAQFSGVGKSFPEQCAPRRTSARYRFALPSHLAPLIAEAENPFPLDGCASPPR
jgi:hypothetical protein